MKLTTFIFTGGKQLFCDKKDGIIDLIGVVAQIL